MDLATLGIGITQQIAGPLLLNAGVINIDAGSEFYGNVINSNIDRAGNGAAMTSGSTSTLTKALAASASA